MSSFDKTRIEQIVTEGKAEQWPYLNTFNALKDAGVHSYETDVASHSIVYYGHTESYTEPTPANFARLKPSQAFDKPALKLAIERNQTKQTDFAGFLDEIARAGVNRYQVDMNARTVSYLGRSGEEYVEKVPQF